MRNMMKNDDNQKHNETINIHKIGEMHEKINREKYLLFVVKTTKSFQYHEKEKDYI